MEINPIWLKTWTFIQTSECALFDKCFFSEIHFILKLLQVKLNINLNKSHIITRDV